MLEVSYLRQHKEEAIERLSRRKLDATQNIEDILRLDEQRRQNQTDLDNVLAEANKLSKEIGQLFKEGKREEAEAAKSKSTELKERSKELESEQHQLKHALELQLMALPNAPHASVPTGSTAEENEEIKRVGVIKDLPEGAKPHWELTEKYGLIDFELGVKITGAGFPVYTGKGEKNLRKMAES